METTNAATTTHEVHAIAFSGRRYGRNAQAFRQVHWTDDVNDGQTLCGKSIAYVEQAGEVRISLPKSWTASERCGTCIARGIGLDRKAF